MLTLQMQHRPPEAGLGESSALAGVVLNIPSYKFQRIDRNSLTILCSLLKALFDSVVHS